MSSFSLRLVEQIVVAGVAGGVGVLVATSEPFSHVALVAAGTAAVRAAYGFIVKSFGDPNQPSAN